MRYIFATNPRPWTRHNIPRVSHQSRTDQVLSRAMYGMEYHIIKIIYELVATNYVWSGTETMQSRTEEQAEIKANLNFLSYVPFLVHKKKSAPCLYMSLYVHIGLYMCMYVYYNANINLCIRYIMLNTDCIRSYQCFRMSLYSYVNSIIYNINIIYIRTIYSPYKPHISP